MQRLVQLLDEAGGQLQIKADDLLVGGDAADAADAVGEVAVDDGAELALSQLWNQ